MRRLVPLFAGLMLISWSAAAEVVTKPIRYHHRDQAFIGYLAYDDAIATKRPGVLVIHEWWGLNDFAKAKARELAKAGYVAFAVDMYGQGKTTTKPDEAQKHAGMIEQQALYVERAKAGLRILEESDLTDPDQLAAIGYCFGGNTVLKLAYSGAGLKGGVAFHASLVAPDDSVQAVPTPLLIQHGKEDPFVEPQTLADVQQKLTNLGADWQLVVFGGAQHSFTNPAADDDGLDGTAYDPRADRMSWAYMKAFLAQVFSR